jgi:alpha-D-ribose 1-methylphosphonate 5-triphosphate synthase subunit PhnH
LLLLTLADEATPVWWQRPDPVAVEWLRFHTRARCAAAPGTASFAVIRDLDTVPPLAEYAQGSDAAPETSATLLIEVAALDQGPALEWRGPGIAELARVRIAGPGAAFWADWQANHARFPRGVDVFWCCGRTLLGLPRTTRAQAASSAGEA